MNASDQRGRGFLIAAWLSVGAGLCLVGAVCVFGYLFGLMVSVDLHTGARGDNLIVGAPKFWAMLLYLAAPFLVGGLALSIAAARRSSVEQSRIARGVVVGVWVGVVMSLIVVPWGLVAWLVLAASYQLSGKDLGRLGVVVVGALLAGVVVAIAGYWLVDTARMVAEAERDVIEQATSLHEAGSLEKGRVGDYIERLDGGGSGWARQVLWDGLTRKLNRPVRSEWTADDRRAIAELAERGLASHDEFVRSRSAELLAAALYMEASSGRFSDSIAQCPNRHCRDHIARMFFDESNPDYPTLTWTTGDVVAAEQALGDRPDFYVRRSAARLLLVNARPGAVCEALVACDTAECDERTFIDGFVDALDRESAARWTPEDVACINEAVSRPRRRYGASRGKKEALELWLANDGLR